MLKKFKRHSAFSLVEFLVVVIIMAAAAGTIFLGVNKKIFRQTARREADLVMRKIYNAVLRADYSGIKFRLYASPAYANYISVRWGKLNEFLDDANNINNQINQVNKNNQTEIITASEGCSFKNLNSAGGYFMTYDPQWGTLTPALTLAIKDYNENLYYLIISGQGRIRISPNPPE